MNNIAICIIAYNRINSLKRLLDSLSLAYYDMPITLIISIDKSNDNSVEKFAQSYIWKFGEKRTIAHPKNLGLRKHILKCGDLLNEFDAIVVLEDDITVAPSFMYYVQQCVEKYANDDTIAGISLYNFPINYQTFKPFTPLNSNSDVYMMQCAMSWGQVWMRKSWNEFKNWYNNNCEDIIEVKAHLPKAICKWPKSSWLKYHTKYVIEKNKFFIYPYISLSTNNSDTGTHIAKHNTIYQANMLYGKKKFFNLNPTIIYDGFFENMNLNLPYKDVCIDYYGEKNNQLNQRYWLTTSHQNYKIIKSYALELKPYEWNILQNREGNELFLYDTHVYSKNKFINNKRLKDYYMYRIPLDNISLIKRFIKNIIKKE